MVRRRLYGLCLAVVEGRLVALRFDSIEFTASVNTRWPLTWCPVCGFDVFFFVLASGPLIILLAQSAVENEMLSSIAPKPSKFTLAPASCSPLQYTPCSLNRAQLRCTGHAESQFRAVCNARAWLPIANAWMGVIGTCPGVGTRRDSTSSTAA